MAITMKTETGTTRSLFILLLLFEISFSALAATPTITSVSPASPVATGTAQEFRINGNNFENTATVTLRNLTSGANFPNRPISGRSSTQITINPTFVTPGHNWTVQVINPGF